MAQGSSLFKAQAFDSLDKSVGSVAQENWTHGQSASPDSAKVKATKLAKSLAW